MNTTLLRLATRHRDGCRTWQVPYREQRVIVVPASRSFWPGSMSVSWPTRDGTRGVRLDWHKSIAKAELRKIIAESEAPNAR